jgi:hypothetical protein
MRAGPTGSGDGVIEIGVHPSSLRCRRRSER